MKREDKTVIGVATFRRPAGLLRLLESLECMETGRNIEIVVAENDAPGLEGATAVSSLVQQGYRWPVAVVFVERRGISEARNALIEAAFRDPTVVALAMVDDDQWVEPGWIDALTDMQEATGATVVGCRVVPDFQGLPGDWTEGLNVFWRESKNDGLCELIVGTDGVLLDRTVLNHCKPPYFDPEFSLTGGGDKEFFVRLSKKGATFAYAGSAIAHEIFGRDRLNVGWACRRAFRIGSTDMRTVLRHYREPRRLVLELFKIAGALVVTPVSFILLAWSTRLRLKHVMRMCRAFGKISALVGVRYGEYRRTYGS